MIDLHCHILPGIDDGPADLETSLEMARLAAADGIKAIVASPHSLDGVYYNSRETILKKTLEFRQALKVAGIPMFLLPGADIHFDFDLQDKLARREALAVNDRNYLLLELPRQFLPPNFKEALFNLKVQGYFPILTHPERNVALQIDPQILGEYVSLGALVQITAMSLTGGFGGKARDHARRWLEQGLVHLIATDAHSPENRPPVLSKALRAATEIVGRKTAVKMVTTWPEFVLLGHPLPEEDLPHPQPSKPAKKHFLARLFS
jgi:protein-tyrosine phosphatase